MTKDKEIKCGDIVRVKRETPRDLYNNLPYSFVTMPFFVAEIERDFGNPMNDIFRLRNGNTRLNIHPHWLEKWPVEVDLNNAYWQHYRAELVKELVLEMKTLNSDCADLITDFATRIVENLKKQSND